MEKTFFGKIWLEASETQSPQFPIITSKKGETGVICNIILALNNNYVTPMKHPSKEVI